MSSRGQTLHTLRIFLVAHSGLKHAKVIFRSERRFAVCEFAWHDADSPAVSAPRKKRQQKQPPASRLENRHHAEIFAKFSLIQLAANKTIEL